MDESKSCSRQLGAEYLARSNYDPQNMVNVITVLKNQERFAADQARAEGRPVAEGSSWLASHPSNEERLRNITQLAAQYKGQVQQQRAGALSVGHQWHGLWGSR